MPFQFHNPLSLESGNETPPGAQRRYGNYMYKRPRVCAFANESLKKACCVMSALCDSDN